MKKNLFMFALFAILFTSCANKKVINGKEYLPYGLLNEEVIRDKSVQYVPSFSALCCGIIFCEMIIPPIYIFGYNYWEPVGLKN